MAQSQEVQVMGLSKRFYIHLWVRRREENGRREKHGRSLTSGSEAGFCQGCLCPLDKRPTGN
jgi:hypothetical protein